MKEIVITSSILIAVVLLLRLLFRGKVSQRLLYCAWLLVAARLLIPFQFGEFALSVHNLTEAVESRSETVQQAQALLQQPVGGPSRSELYQQVELEYAQLGFDTAAPSIQSQIEKEVDSKITVPTLRQVLTGIWIAGMAGMGIWFVCANLIYLRKAKQGAIPFAADSPVRVWVSENVPTPCLTGLLRPVIYLTPQTTANPKMITHVMAHELTHLRHGDLFWSLVRCVCLCIYWFNPLVWLAARESRRDCELACDEGALARLGEHERIDYGKTLLATVSQAPVRLLNTATAMNETKQQLKERMCFIVKKPRTFLLAAIAIILVAALATGCAFAGGPDNVPSSSIDPPEEDTTSTTQPENTQGPPVTNPPVTEPPTTEPSKYPNKFYFNVETKPEDLHGAWIAHVRLNEAEPITYTIRLKKDGTVEYSLGLYGSDLIETYSGTWKTAGEPYPEGCYILEMTGHRCVEEQDYPSFGYYGILELDISNDGEALRATWRDGNFLFKFYNTTSLLMYRFLEGEDTYNYYDIPVQNVYAQEG